MSEKWVQWINTGGTETKTYKTAFWRCQCFAPVVSVAACLISSRCLNQPHHTPNAALPSEGGGIAKRIKTARLRRKTKPGRSAHNYDTILNINHLSRTRSIASLPCKIVLGDTTSFQEIILLSGVFRRETASGFYPWGKVDSPRKRVAEGLCGWRHGNSFPMTQSAQSHRQMRSIPHCSKAVFYVFVFDSIHNSATLHNLCPQKFPTESIKILFAPIIDAVRSSEQLEHPNR